MKEHKGAQRKGHKELKGKNTKNSKERTQRHPYGGTQRNSDNKQIHAGRAGIKQSRRESQTI